MIRKFLIVLCCSTLCGFAQKDSSLAKIQQMRDQLDAYMNSSNVTPSDKPNVVFLSKTVYDSMIDLLQKQQSTLSIVQQTISQMRKQMGNIKSEGISVSKQLTDTVFFETNSFALTPAAVRQIDQFIKACGTNKYYSVDGFADKKGNKDANFNLSKSRAIAVKDYIARKYAINPDKISTGYYGNDLLICPSDDDSCNRLNRRVEIHLK